MTSATTEQATWRALISHLKQGQAVAYCRLVETRGSTPQKAGAVMLVHANGEQAGTLGGGCVEAEVKRRAIQALDRNIAELADFQLNHDYGWDDGLICGGRMRVLIQPLRQPGAPEYFADLVHLMGEGRGLTEVIAFEHDQLPVPQSLLFDDQGSLVHQLGPDPSVSEAFAATSLAEIQRGLKSLESRPRPYLEQGVAYLPTLPRCRLLIVGGGHIGKAVAELATQLEFDVWIADDRESYVSPERFPGAERLLLGSIPETLADLEITPDTYCLIVTRGHSHDEQALYHLAERNARYVGMIGSRRKIKMIFDDLLQEGVSPAALARVYAPLGIDIGSQTVPEIAVSICAELIAHRNLNGQVPGRPAPVRLSISVDPAPPQP